MTGSRISEAGEPSPETAGLAASPGADGAFRIGLKKRAEFQRAARGRRCHAKSLTLQAFPRPDDTEGPFRFGLTVTKRVGNAVERNRIKRRFREALRLPGLAARPGHDYVIVARREALTVSFSGLSADLGKTLDQACGGRSSGRHGKSGRPDRPRDPAIRPRGA